VQGEKKKRERFRKFDLMVFGHARLALRLFFVALLRWDFNCRSVALGFLALPGAARGPAAQGRIFSAFYGTAEAVP
jgi:hypothetical protein